MSDYVAHIGGSLTFLYGRCKISNQNVDIE